MPESNSNTPLAEVGRFPRLAEAREHALALAAIDLAYAIERDGDEWVLCVDESARDAAAAELENVRAEEKRKASARPAPPLEKIRPFSLWVFGWLLGGCYFAEQAFGPAWIDRGEADAEAIVQHGEWWRAITALTLHGDASHLIANLATGVLFAAFLLPQFGTGLTWLLILLTGALGNLINSWGYRGESHHSIGASTAVFGALGLLAGSELWARWSDPATRTRWQLVLPLGAGLSLLAYLGVGDKHGQIDYMAHCWGFATGLGFGIGAAAFRFKQLLPPLAQYAASTTALLLVFCAWLLALR